jgi:biotin operon repressor
LAYHKSEAPSIEELFICEINFNDLIGLNISYHPKTLEYKIIQLTSDWINVGDIAKHLKVSDRTIFRKLNVLKKDGLEFESSKKGIKIKPCSK